MDWKQYREAQREESVKAAKADILLDEIARREGIEVLDAEVDAEIGALRRAHAAVRRKRCARKWRRRRSERAARAHPRGQDP